MFFFVMKRRHTTSQRKATLVPDTTLFRSDPATGDNVLASIDDLVHTAISGHAPVGGTITGLTVTDGTTTVTVDPATLTVNPDGGLRTTADLSGLKRSEAHTSYLHSLMRHSYSVFCLNIQTQTNSNYP